MNGTDKKNKRRWFNLKQRLAFWDKDNLSFTPQAENDWLLIVALFFLLLAGALALHFFIYSLIMEGHNVITGTQGEEIILAEDKINEAYNYLKSKENYQVDIIGGSLETDG